MNARLAMRLFSAGLALSTGVVLALSIWLDPSPKGHSTHLQLGLGQCTFLSATGYPCPMCGCTTSFAWMAHLNPAQAVVTQPFGTALFLGTVATFALSIAEVVHPRDRWVRLADRLAPYENQLATLFLMAMGAGWIYKIVVMRWL